MATNGSTWGRSRSRREEAGQGDELVILLHGFPEIAHSWRHQLPALAEAGYRAVAPDLRGYGESTRRRTVADYAFPKLVGDIVGVDRRARRERAHLVGHDWGGSIAWALAARAPHLVRA